MHVLDNLIGILKWVWCAKKFSYTTKNDPDEF